VLGLGIDEDETMATTDERYLVWMLCFGHRTEGFDCDGRLVRYSEYGKLSACGWEIDHTVPTSWGGPDLYANKRPRHWQGNRRAGGLINAWHTSADRSSASGLGLENALVDKKGALPSHNGLATGLINALMDGNPYWKPTR
jgi:hypothetical protein